jgi:transposase
MQGKKPYQEKLFVSFQLSNAVPADNIYRRLKELVDFSFLYKATNKYYGEEGQKSIDPVVFMKLMLVGYLENLNSDRRIVSISKMRLDILYFIGYDIDEELPWHSTLSRTRQLYGQEVFTKMFRAVLKQCIDKGMVSGRRQAIDGVYVKANASLDSMVEREIMDDVDAFGRELEANQQEQKVPVANINQDHHRDYDDLAPKKNPSNKTHYSPTDPDAKMSVKPGKATALNYLGQVSVDTVSHVVTHVQAFTADKRDSECLPEVVEQLLKNLGENDIRLEEVVADKGYSSGEAIKALEQKGIIGYIPNRGQFVYQRDNFNYQSDGDYYICPNGKNLTYRGISKDGNYYNKLYSLAKKECIGCPLSQLCSAYGKNGIARIKETVDRPYYERMHLRMQTKKAKILMKKRQSTVEPVIGILVNYLGMKRISVKGLAQANKCMTLAAVAYNLKKMLKYRTEYIQQKQQTVMKSQFEALKQIFSRITRYEVFFAIWHSVWTRNKIAFSIACY